MRKSDIVTGQVITNLTILHGFYIIVHVSCMSEERGVYRVLVGKPEGKRPLGRPRRR